MTWSKLRALVKSHSRFLISTHVNPDGDCIGSEVAFHWYLTSLGKEALVYNRDPVPHKLAFIDPDRVIGTQRPSGDFDVLVALDASSFDRLGWEGCAVAAPVVVNIDHHRDNARFGDCAIVDTEAAATGEVICRYFEEIGLDYPATIAQALYAAIMTDTGGFRFSNTTGRVLRLCAGLAERGADCALAYREAYGSYSPAGLLLRATIWSTLAFHLDNRVCSIELPDGLIEKLNANYGDSEGMADVTVTAAGTEVGVLIKHSASRTHFSLRSTGRIDVGRLARRMGNGGGHESAAGCTVDMPIAKAREWLLALIAEELG